MEEYGQELNSFEEIVKKTIDAKNKATFRPCFYARKIDQHWLWGSWAVGTKAGNQSQPIKDSRFEKPKA